jgi:hypothetical protein
MWLAARIFSLRIGFWKFAATGAILGAYLLGPWSLDYPLGYLSESRLEFGTSNSDGAFHTLNQATGEAFSSDELSAIIHRRNLYPSHRNGFSSFAQIVPAFATLSVKLDPLGAMRQDLQIALTSRPSRMDRGELPSTFILAVSFRHPDPQTATVVNADIMTVYARMLASYTGPDGKRLELRFLDLPSIRERPMNQPLSTMLAMGSALGAVLASLTYGIVKLAPTFSRPAASQ